MPIEFAKELFEYSNKISSVEISLETQADKKKIQAEISSILGDSFSVKNRFQQQEVMYKTIKSEKLIGFLILLFIIFIASFNVIGSLTMLIIDKKKDIETLLSLGANFPTIRKIFLIEGWLISVTGAFLGLVLGVTFCLLQQKYGIIALQGNGSFIVDSYPVEIYYSDLFIIFISVITIGFIAAWYPVRYITQRYL